MHITLGSNAYLGLSPVNGPSSLTVKRWPFEIGESISILLTLVVI